MSAEDRACVALLFCSTFGVGSTRFGSVFAAAGPLVGSIAVYFISACNLHASVAVSKTLNAAPYSVRSFSDIGFYVYGDLGRRVVIIGEAANCFLSPIAFLILGGNSLLPYIFQGVLDGITTTQWILIMSLGLLPIVLIPTLRAAVPLCYVGGLCAVFTDVICVCYSLHSMPYEPRETQLSLDNSIETFGTIMFALGTSILIPPIQRQHSEPSRLVNIISITLLVITSFYLLIGIATYFQYGCTAPETLLDELPDGVWRRIACSFMLLHVIIAFPVLMSPSLFDLERFVLGRDADLDVLHRSIRSRNQSDGKPIMSPAVLSPSPIVRINTPAGGAVSHEENPFLYDALHFGQQPTAMSSAIRPVASADSGANPAGSSEPSETLQPSCFITEPTPMSPYERCWSIVVRTCIVSVQVSLAIMFQASFSEFLSLIGATAVTISCMVMPCLCYLKVYPIPTTFVGKCDRFLCYVTIYSSIILGSYGSCLAVREIYYNLLNPFDGGSGSALLNSSSTMDEDDFPFCHVGERN